MAELMFDEALEVYGLGNIVKPVFMYKPVVGQAGVLRLTGRKDREVLEEAEVDRIFLVSYTKSFAQTNIKYPESDMGQPRRGLAEQLIGDGSLVECVSFQAPDRAAQPQDCRAPDLEQHPYFLNIDGPYLDVERITKKDGSIDRRMVRDDGRHRKFNISKWDADVVERLKTLPDHLRAVLSV